MIDPTDPTRATRSPRGLWHVVLCALVACAFLAPAFAEDEKKDDGAKPVPPKREYGTRESAGVGREEMWPAPTAEDWKKPCLITLQRTWEDARRGLAGDRQADPDLRQHGRRDRQRALRRHPLPPARDRRALRALRLRDRVGLPPHAARLRRRRATASSARASAASPAASTSRSSRSCTRSSSTASASRRATSWSSSTARRPTTSTTPTTPPRSSTPSATAREKRHAAEARDRAR